MSCIQRLNQIRYKMEKIQNSYFINRRSCPVCLSDDINLVYKENFTSAPIADYLLSFYGKEKDFSWIKNVDFLVSECQNCELIFQNNVLSDSATEFFYTNIVSSVHNEVKGTDQDIPESVKVVFLREAKRILDYMSSPHPDNIPYFLKLLRTLFLFWKKPSKKQSLRLLDYGCGTCSWAKIIKDMGNSYPYHIIWV